MAVYSHDRVNRLRMVLGDRDRRSRRSPRVLRGVHPGERRPSRRRSAGDGRGRDAARCRRAPRSSCSRDAGRPRQDRHRRDGRPRACCPASALAGSWLAFLLPLMGLGLLFLALISDEVGVVMTRTHPGRAARGRRPARTCSATGSRRPAARSTSSIRTPATPCPTLDGYAGLLVMGGAMGANDDEALDWIGPVKELIRDAVDRGCPDPRHLPRPPADGRARSAGG